MTNPIFINSIYIKLREDKNTNSLIDIDIDVDEFCNLLAGLKDEKGKAHLQAFQKQFPSRTGLSHNVIIKQKKDE